MASAGAIIKIKLPTYELLETTVSTVIITVTDKCVHHSRENSQISAITHVTQCISVITQCIFLLQLYSEYYQKECKHNHSRITACPNMKPSMVNYHIMQNQTLPVRINLELALHITHT